MCVCARTCACLGVCQREGEIDFYSFFPLSLQGTVFLRFISPKCLTICPLFKLLEKPFSWSAYKQQRARLWLLYPIAYPSSKHALDLNAGRQFKQLPHIWDWMCKQACPSPFVTKYGTWLFLWRVHSDHILYNIFQIYSWVFWRTRHICSFTIDMLLKTAVSGTTV